MTKKIALLGAGGNSLDIVEAVNEIGGFEIIGYLNKNEDYFLKESIKLKYLGSEDEFNYSTLDGLIITFAGLGEKIKARKLTFKRHSEIIPSIIFKKSSISKFSNISKKGVMIFGSTVLKSFCNIEDNVFINSGTIIGHHVTIKKHSVISIGVLIGGRVTIEEDVFIGMGAKIFQNVCIGRGSIIGAGVIVRKDLKPYSKVL